MGAQPFWLNMVIIIMKNNTLSLSEVAGMFGTSIENLSDSFIDYYNSLDMNYEIITKEEERALILDILKRMDSDSQVIGAPERTEVWRKGWEENLLDFKSSKNKQSIIPKFIRPNQIIRLNKKFVKTSNPFFEKDFAKLSQLHAYNKFITKDIDEVHEFGCGSGFNLISLSEEYPDLKIFGSDFVQTSVELINELSSHYNINLEGHFFDMIEPDYNYKMGSNSCVFTHGSLEQLANKYKNFINFLIYKKPKICFHIEPTIEVYDKEDLFDYLQIKFHNQRGYSTGMLSYLEEKQRLGLIKDLSCKRIFFGNKFMEGYTLTSWRTA